MASPATNPGGAPQGAQPNPQGGNPQGGGPQPLQILAGMTRLTQVLAEAAPPCAPEAEQIVQLLQKCAQKIMGAQQPGQGGPAPY